MEGTSVILKNWNWKFTEGYAQFYIVIRGAKKRRNRLVDWPAAPLRDLIHAIDMGNLTLIPKSKEDSKSTKRSMKPRRTVTKPPSSHRMFPKSSVDTDASDSEYNDWNSSARIIQDTPESDDEYSQYADSGDTIRVQSPLPNTTHRPKRCNLTSCGRCGNTVIDRSTGDALQDAYCKPSSTQKLLGSWFEKLSSMARDGSEAINLSLVHDAQERVRLQQTIKNQQEQLAQKEKELLGQTTALRSHNNTLHRLSQLISRASSRLDGEGEQDSLEVVDDGQSDGEYVPSQTSKPTIHGQKEESDLETDLQGLICKFESRVDKLNHQNNNNATLNSALLDQQTKLRQQLKDKDVEVKKAEQRGRQEGERLAGTSSHRPEEDQVLRFVTQYPVFNKDGKVIHCILLFYELRFHDVY
jgi:hypothetical protein